MKYRHRDLRNVLERSSARETAIRVAVGNVCEQLLAAFGVTLVGYVQAIGPVDTDLTKPQTVSEIKDAITQNDLRILAQDRVAELHDLIDQTRRAGDTLGGWIRVVVNGMPAGIGSYVS